MSVLIDRFLTLSRFAPFTGVLLFSFMSLDIGAQDCFGDGCTDPDITPPMFLSTPQPIAPLTCRAPLPDQEDLEIADDCSDATLIKEVLPFIPNSCSGYSITYRWIAVDECDNADTILLTFDILPDTEKPVFLDAPPPFEDITCNVPFPNVPIIGAMDNCTRRVIVDFEQEELLTSQCISGLVIYRWIASDDCGNKDTIESQFNIIPDGEDPILEEPLPIPSVSCGQMLPTPESLEVFDNCGSLPVEFDILPYEENVCEGYEVTYRWTVSDLCGNTDTAMTTFSVLADIEPPVVLGTQWSSDEVFDPELCQLLPVLTDVAQLGGDIIATDDCTSDLDLRLVVTDERLVPDTCSGDRFENRVVERLYQVVDNCGNESAPVLHRINYQISRCEPLTNYGRIAIEGQTIVTTNAVCRPPPITPTEPIEGQCGIVEYMWLSSEVSLPDGSGRPYPFTGSNLGSIWQIVPDASEESYHPPILSQRTHFLRCARNFSCCLFAGESNGVTINVDTLGTCFMMVQECDNNIELISPINDVLDRQYITYLSDKAIEACNTASANSALNLSGKRGVILQENFSIQKSARLTIATSGCQEH